MGAWNAVIYKRKALDSVGGFKPELCAASDAVAALLIACKYGACFIPEALSCMRVLPTSYSMRGNKDIDGLKDVYKSLRELSISGPLKELATPENTKQTNAVLSYIINTLTLSQLQDKELDFLKENMPPKNFLGKVMFLLIKMGIKSQKILYNLYVFKHSKRRIWPVVYNNLFRTLHFHILYFISKMRR